MFGVSFWTGLGFDLRDRRTRAGGGDGAVGVVISSAGAGPPLPLDLPLGTALALAAVVRFFLPRDAATSSGDALAKTNENDLNHLLERDRTN